MEQGTTSSYLFTQYERSVLNGQLFMFSNPKIMEVTNENNHKSLNRYLKIKHEQKFKSHTIGHISLWITRSYNHFYKACFCSIFKVQRQIGLVPK